jgi:polysaccharide chain length determinant protein (PEP-CTERM system associated)
MLPGKTLTPALILGIVRRRAWLLAIPPFVGLFVALIVSAYLPNLYQSDVLVAIIPQRVPDSFVRTTVTLKTEERLAAIETQVTSRTLIEQLINEFDLYPSQRATLPLEDVIELMRFNIAVVPETPRRGPRGPEPLHAFHVRFTYTDPQAAARVTQRIGLMFVDQNARDRSALAEATNQFLETQLVQSREQLEATELKLKQFREIHGKELPTQLQTNMTGIQSTQLQIQALVQTIANDRNRRMMLERLYNDSLTEPLPVTPQSQQPAATQSVDPSRPVSGTPEQQLAAMRAALAALELRFTPDHPDVRNTKRTIAELEEKVKLAAKGAQGTATPAVGISLAESQRRERLSAQRAEIESLDRQLQFNEAEEKRLRGVLADYQGRIEAVPGLETEWTALTRDYDARKLTYDQLVTKSEEARVAVDLERRQIGEQFRILDPATVPLRPISPVRYQINAIGLAVGLLLGVGITALLELRDRSFRTEVDIVDVLAVPVLAIIPFVRSAQDQARFVRRQRLATAGAVLAVGGVAYVVWSMRLWTFLI